MHLNLCLFLGSIYLVTIALGASNRQEILDRVNNFRRDWAKGSKIANMNQLVYDEKIHKMLENIEKVCNKEIEEVENKNEKFILWNRAVLSDHNKEKTILLPGLTRIACLTDKCGKDSLICMTDYSKDAPLSGEPGTVCPRGKNNNGLCVVLTEKERHQEIVDFINDMRRKSGKANMNQVVYDEELHEKLENFNHNCKTLNEVVEDKYLLYSATESEYKVEGEYWMLPGLTRIACVFPRKCGTRYHVCMSDKPKEPPVTTGSSMLTVLLSISTVFFSYLCL